MFETRTDMIQSYTYEFS